MNDRDPNDGLEQLDRMLQELGPADPPPGFAGNVMARISSEAIHRDQGRVVPLNRARIALTRNAMWGIAAAAAVVLSVFAVRGFPPVGTGTEGTIGAARKQQAPQFVDNAPGLGDAAAQEFLQSDTFERLAADPGARDLLNNAAIKAALKDPAFVAAIRDAGVRDALGSGVVRGAFADGATRAALEDAYRAKTSGAAAKTAATEATLNAQSRAADALEDPQVQHVLAHSTLRQYLANDLFRRALADPNIAAAWQRPAFVDAISRKGFDSAIRSPHFDAALARR